MIVLSESADELSGIVDRISTRSKRQDCLFLALIVFLSLILYVNKLGFYSDDWVFLSLLDLSDDQSLSGLYRALFAGDVVIRQRPVQIVFLVLSYKLFGLKPLGFHLTNGIVLAASAILFYLSLRELRQSRVLALAIPLVYILLPHYSTDRFWLAAFQATLGMAFYFLSLYADLRAVRGRLWQWKAVSVVCLAFSLLAYEVALPLFLLNLLLIVYQAREIYGPMVGHQFVRSKAAPLFAGNLVALLLLAGFKALITVRANVEVDLLSHIAFLVAGALRVNYGTYGVGLPYILFWIFRHQLNWAVLAVGSLVGVAIFAYLYQVANRSQMPARIVWPALIGSGLLVFGLGYGIFMLSADVWFTSASLGNRTAIAAAVGVALSFVGVLGWVTSYLPSAQWRRASFGLLVALLCAAGFVINNTLANFWGEAYRRQQAIHRDIREHVPVLPAQSTFILDGVCLEHGGAYIFTGKRDLAGLLAIAYQDTTLWATAITNPAEIEEEGLSLFTYRDRDHFPYAENLFIYHFEQQRLYRLTSARVARRYFEQANFDPGRDCAPGFAWGWNSRW